MINADFIHYSFLFFFTLTLVIKFVLLLMNIKHVKGNYSEVPPQFQEIITLEDHQKAQNYTITKNKFNLIGILFHGVILLLWLETGVLATLQSVIEPLSTSVVIQGVLYLIAFSLINSLISLPESLYSTFCIEEKYGFNKMTPKIFVIDLFKQFALSMIIGVPFIYLVLKILYSLGDLWWLYTWVFIIGFQFIIIWAYPKFIAPLFNKFSKLDDEELTAEVDKLSERCQINFKDYYIMNASIRSSHGNAYFTGFGKNKRIVFFDTLLKSLETNEVVAVLAHELGHLKRKHIMKSIIISSLFLLLGLYILGALYSNPALFQAFGLTGSEPYLALLLFVLISPYYTFLFTPLSSWMSRKNEFEADEFAATHASGKKLISALLKMYKDNSSTLTPHPVYSKFYFSHPPAKERIEFLKSFNS
jgi:STE24 endopeptidase